MSQKAKAAALLLLILAAAAYPLWRPLFWTLFVAGGLMIAYDVLFAQWRR